MNVLVLESMAPFRGSNEQRLAGHLCTRLNTRAGVAAELLRVPFSGEPVERLAEEVFLNRSLQLSHVDRVIALNFPSYLVPHHTKMLWLMQQARDAYDLRGRGGSHIPAARKGERIRKLIQLLKRKRPTLRLSRT